MCRVAQDNSWNIQVLKSLTTTVCCVMVCGVVLRSVGKKDFLSVGKKDKVTDRLGESVGKVTDRLGESVGKVGATINERWGETNNLIGAFGAPFTFLCWSVSIYLLSESGKVNRLQCVCPFL
jgi:hypothetical protein